MEKFVVSRDDNIYEAWPDVALTASGSLVCVFSECTHHGNRSYTRIMITRSDDRGRTWSPKQPLTEGTADCDYYYNCARITALTDGRLVVVVDCIHSMNENDRALSKLKNALYFSDDDGVTWSDAQETSILGIVPDKVIELKSGRWLVGAHYKDSDFGYLIQQVYYSDDQGKTWSNPVIIGRQEGLNLCEVSICEVSEGVLVALMRENSMSGMDCYKAISYDQGESWSELIRFPLPGLHRPVLGPLADGRFLITYRFLQGGKGWLGAWTQNFFGALTDLDSLVSLRRQDAMTRVFPIDYDRSSVSDLGYSGWVQFDDGEIYIVNYIVDDAPKAQIRGYSLRLEELIIDTVV